MKAIVKIIVKIMLVSFWILLHCAYQHLSDYFETVCAVEISAICREGILNFLQARDILEELIAVVAKRGL